jgi:hypothetical protein
MHSIPITKSTNLKMQDGIMLANMVTVLMLDQMAPFILLFPTESTITGVGRADGCLVLAET